MGCLFGVALQLHAQGYIVPNGVSYTGLNIFGAYEIRVLQNPSNGNYTGFWLAPQGMTQPINTFSFDRYLDEGVRVFLVSANQPISLQGILANNYTELTYPNSYVFDSGIAFYVGLYTGETFPQNGVYDDPLFGWARLLNDQGTILMLDSALAYKAGGIYVGTQNLIPIPEPGTIGLLALGALLLVWRLRQTHH